MPETAETISRNRVSKTHSALYSQPRTLRKRRRCDGHLSHPHWIEAGEQAIWSSLPPDSEIGNTGWWHAVFCMECAPIECMTSQHPPPTRRPRAKETDERAEVDRG